VKLTGLASLGIAGFAAILTTSAQAQVAAPVLPAPAAKGETQNLSATTGSRSQLSFGTNSNFGVSASTQNSAGMTVLSRSELKPSFGTISSSVGLAEGKSGRVVVNISNLRAQGDQGNIGLGKAVTDANGNPIVTDGGSINLTGPVALDGNGNVLMVAVRDALGNVMKDPDGNAIMEPLLTNSVNYAAGNAVLDGIQAEVNLEIDPDSTGFYTEVAPNTLGGDNNACGFGNYDPSACRYATKYGTKPGVYTPVRYAVDDNGNPKLGADGKPIEIGTWGPMSIIIDQYTGKPVLDNSGNEIPVTSTEQAFGNGSANSSLSTNTNVDIQTSNFANSFAQSF